MYFFEDHTADIMIVVKSESLLNFFNDILLALWEIFINKNPEITEESCEKVVIEKNYKIEFSIGFENDEELIYNFLSKYVFFSEVNKFVMKKIESVDIRKDSAYFKAGGIILKKIVSYIKAPTYHNFEVDLKNYFFRGVLDV